MAEVVFGCPHCGEAVSCDTEYAGQTVACPHCQGGIIVPAEAPAPVEEPAASDQSPVISEQEAAPQPEPTPTPEDQPAPEPEPTPEPAAQPEPAPAPAPELEPVAEPTPEPAPQPEPKVEAPAPAPEPEPVASDQEAAPEVEVKPEPKVEEAPAPELTAETPASEGDKAEAKPDEPVAPKPKQPRLPKPGTKTGKKKMVTKRKIVTKKGPGVSSAAAGAAGAAGAAASQKPAAKTQASDQSSVTSDQKPAEELAPGELPKEAKGWSWAAFLWGPIWAIGNKVWFGLLTLIPVVNIVMIFILAAKGKKKAWANAEAKGKTVEQFAKAQKRWVVIWLILLVVNILATVGVVVLGGGAAIMALRGLEPTAITIEQTTPEGGASSDDMGGYMGEIEEPTEGTGGGVDETVEVIEESSEGMEAPPAIDMGIEEPPALDLGE